MDISRDRFLSFARRIALVTSTAAPAVAACSGSTTNTAATTAPIPATAPSPSSTSESPPNHDVTAGGGPCRCSWDTNGAAAPRVCKKGEVNYAGVACIPGGPTSYEEGGYYPQPVPGPLPPPDLPA